MISNMIFGIAASGNHLSQTHAILLIISVPKSSTAKLWLMCVKADVHVILISLHTDYTAKDEVFVFISLTNTSIEIVAAMWMKEFIFFVSSC